MMGRRPDSILGKRKIVIGMLTAGMMNLSKLIDIFKLVSLRYPVLEPISVWWAVSEIENHSDRSRKTTRREDIDKVMSFRRNRFLRRVRIPGLGRNATGTRICAKTGQILLYGARLRWRRPYAGVPLTVYINVWDLTGPQHIACVY